MSIPDGLRSANPQIDWAKIEKALIPRTTPPLSFKDIYGSEDVHVRTCQEGGRQHIWKVVDIKRGRVFWHCVCKARTTKQVRIYGILPARYLFVRRSHWLPPLASVVPTAEPS